MKKSKKEKQQELEADFNKIGSIVSGMQTPQMPEIDSEWNEFEKRIDAAEGKKTISLFLKTRIFVASVASTFLLLVAVYSYLNLKENKFVAANNTRTIILKDSSVIYLNRHSSVSYNAGYGILNRDISLIGEAFFKVKKGKGRFIVKTNVAQIIVTGTQFNVKARRNKTEVGVSEGRVEFSSASIPNSIVALTCGLFSSCEYNNAPIAAIAVPFSKFPDWIHNRLLYSGSTVKMIVADIEEQFNIKIIVNDPKNLNLEVTGVLEGNNPDELLQTLCLLIGKKYRLNKDKYEVY